MDFGLPCYLKMFLAFCGVLLVQRVDSAFKLISTVFLLMVVHSYILVSKKNQCTLLLYGVF